jgi:catechol 2,3-dioxygenase-like lactoylglutathione lyase family enzyme
MQTRPLEKHQRRLGGGMPIEARLNIVTLGVSDLKRARKFYAEGLGWKASSASQDNIVFFQLGGIVLALYPRTLLAEDATVGPSGSGFRGITLAQNVREKDEVFAVLKMAEAAGGKVVKPAQDVFWGGHSGYFADPDGHLWEVAWNPHFDLNVRGEVELP